MQPTKILRTSCALGAIRISVQPCQWKIIQGSGNRDLAGLEAHNRDVTYGVAELEPYKQAPAGLGKKK